jgi:hypothetical protein
MKLPKLQPTYNLVPFEWYKYFQQRIQVIRERKRGGREGWREGWRKGRKEGRKERERERESERVPRELSRVLSLNSSMVNYIPTNQKNPQTLHYYKS